MGKKKRKFIGYYRVSTKRQGLSGLGLDAQRESVMGFLARMNGDLIAEFIEVETGKGDGNGRPQLAAALAQCRLHNATLVIAKLDRLARNVNFISNLMESEVEFVAVDFPEANRLTIHILAAVAEHEARCISERTKAALAAYKRKGNTLGGDRGNCHLIYRKGAKASAIARRETAERRAADLRDTIEAIKAEGAVSLRDIADGLNQRGIGTARGTAWSATQVYRVLGTLATL